MVENLGEADDSNLQMINHLQKTVAYQQLATEIVNDAFAKATASGTPINEGFQRPQAILNEVSVTEYILPALYRKIQILSKMTADFYSSDRPDSEEVRKAYFDFERFVETMQDRSDFQIQEYTRGLRGESEDIDVTRMDLVEQQAMDTALLSLNTAMQIMGIDAEGFLDINRQAFNEVRKSIGLGPLGVTEFREMYIGGLEGRPARFFSE